MHKCWFVPELAAQIAGECAPGYKHYSRMEPGGASQNLASLCALARTCRLLSDTALDVIWYYQFGLHTIVQNAFSVSFWEVEQDILPVDLDSLPMNPPRRGCHTSRVYRQLVSTPAVCIDVRILLFSALMLDSSSFYNWKKDGAIH